MITKRRFTVAGAATAAVFALSVPSAAQQLDQAVDAAERSTAAAAQAQDQINQISRQTADINVEYRRVLQAIANQQLYVDQQGVFLASQQNEIADLERQINEVEDVLRNLLPMQNEMIEALDAFVRGDIPFKRAERIDRVQRLRDLMNNPAVAPAERYRQIVDTYQVEADAGRFFDEWSGPLNQNPLSGEEPDETAPTVDYLLIGRVAFIYITQDDRELAIWNNESGAWDALDASHRAGVRLAIRIARETTAPNVFVGPVPAAVPAGDAG